VDPETGEHRLLFRPGASKRVVMGDAPMQGDRLFLSIRPVRGRYRGNEVVALRLR